MQLWRGTSAPCRFSFQRLWLPSTTQAFSTTPFLERSKLKIKPNKGSSKQKTPTADTNSKGQSYKSPSRPVGGAGRKPVNHENFLATVESGLDEIWNDIDKQSPERDQYAEFEELVVRACTTPENALHSDSQALSLKQRLERSFFSSGPPATKKLLEKELLYAGLNLEVTEENTKQQQKKIADIRYPAEWYPGARAIQRTIHLHVGPTNSGKTYHALKRLEEAKSGFYAGPLRLLAHEVYTRLNGKGIPCGLLTGDEVKFPEDENPTIFSNTVEMVPLNKNVEVAVIDEIQMIGDAQRGWAWTRALLGSQANEVHLCGETRVVPLIREIAASLGDSLEIHHYQRLNPLKPLSKSLKGDFRNLRKGDCVVSFSRLQIHALKQEIERTTGRRAAIVYGSLPAEIRSQQADLFNNPDNDYDFLVASDAIGMGLNLSCKRVIFETLVKRVPGGLERLSIPQIKQIGGRAGRYRSAAQTSEQSSDSDDSNVGFVTSLEDVDLPYISEALKAEPQPILAAGLLPPDELVHRFAAYHPPTTPFPYLLRRLHSLVEVNPRYFLCDTRQQIETAEVIDQVDNLDIADRLIFLASPAPTRDPGMGLIVQGFARCVTEHKSGALLEIPELDMDILNQPVSAVKEYMRSLESLHRALVLYLWLSYRCGGIFTDRTLATHVKQLVEERMDRALTEFSANKKLRKESSLHRQLALLKQMQERDQAFENQADEELALNQLDAAGVSSQHTVVYDSIEEAPETRESTTTS
ncbi:RNA helicase [Arachnomyces sp. PD_36]|nr:RNA helicase [Arachnomyces sp. PD_36]